MSKAEPTNCVHSISYIKEAVDCYLCFFFYVLYITLVLISTIHSSFEMKELSESQCQNYGRDI